MLEARSPGSQVWRLEVLWTEQGESVSGLSELLVVCCQSLSFLVL